MTDTYRPIIKYHQWQYFGWSLPYWDESGIQQFESQHYADMFFIGSSNAPWRPTTIENAPFQFHNYDKDKPSELVYLSQLAWTASKTVPPFRFSAEGDRVRILRIDRLP